MVRIRGINKIVTGISLLFFPPLLYIVRIVTVRPFRPSRLSLLMFRGSYLPFEIINIA